MSKRHKNINPSGCGVYIIQNTDNKNIYVGSSLNCEKRFKNHVRDLKKGIHANNYLQNAFNYHGETKFKFKVLYNCNAEERVKFEFDEIKKIVDKGNGGTLYNIVKNPEMIHQNWYIRKMKQDGYILCESCSEFFIPILKNQEHIEIYEKYSEEYIEHNIKHDNMCDFCLECEVNYIESELYEKDLEIRRQDYNEHCCEEGLGEYIYAVLPRCIIDDMIESGSWED